MELDLDILSEYGLNPSDISLIAEIQPSVIKDIMDLSFSKKAQHFLDNDRLIKLPANKAELLAESTIGSYLQLVEEDAEKGTVTFTVPGYIFKKLDEVQYYAILDAVGKDSVIQVMPTSSGIAPETDVEVKKLQGVNDAIFSLLNSLDHKLEELAEIDLWKGFISKMDSMGLPSEVIEELTHVGSAITDVLEKTEKANQLEAKKPEEERKSKETILSETAEANALGTWFKVAKDTLKSYKEQLIDQIDKMELSSKQVSSKDHFGEFLKHLYIVKDDVVNEVNHILTRFKQGEIVLETMVIGDRELELVKDLTSQRYFIKIDDGGKVQKSTDINLNNLESNLMKKTKEYSLGPLIRLLDKNVWGKYDKFIEDSINKAFKEKNTQQTYPVTIDGHGFSIRMDKVGDEWKIYLFSVDPDVTVPNNIVFEKTVKNNPATLEIDSYKLANQQYNHLLNILNTLEGTKPASAADTLQKIQDRFKQYDVQGVTFNRLSFYVFGSTVESVMRDIGVYYVSAIRDILSHDFHEFNTEKLLKNVLRYFDGTQLMKNWLSENEDLITVLESRMNQGSTDEDVLKFLKDTVGHIVGHLSPSYLELIKSRAVESKVRSGSWLRRWALPVDVAPGGEPAMEIPSTEESGVLPEHHTYEPSSPDLLTEMIKKQQREEREKAEEGKELENVNRVVGAAYMKMIYKYHKDEEARILLSYLNQAISNKLRAKGFEFNIESLPGFHVPEGSDLNFISGMIKRTLNLSTAPHTDKLEKRIKELYTEYLDEVQDENLKDILSL